MATTLPTNIYTGILGEYVDTMTPTTEAPPQFHFGAFATVLSLVFHDAYIQLGDSRLHLTLFTLLVGPTGAAKKSTSANSAQNMLDRINPGIPVIHAEGSRQGLLKALIDKGLPIDPLLFEEFGIAVEDEKKKSKISAGECKPTLIRAREYTSVLKRSGMHGLSDLTEFYLDLYDRPKRLENNVVAWPLVLINPVAALLGDSTEELLADVFGSSNIDNGLLNRLTIFQGTNVGGPKDYPPKPDEARLADIARRVQEIRTSLPEGPFEIEIPESSRKLWKKMYGKYFDRRQDAIGAVIAREGDRALQFAALYAILDGRQAISVEDLETAEEVVDYLSEVALSVAGKVGRSDKAKTYDYVLDRITDRYNQGKPVKPGEVGSIVTGSWRGKVRDVGGPALVARSLLADGDLTLDSEGRLVPAIEAPPRTVGDIVESLPLTMTIKELMSTPIVGTGAITP